MGGTFFLSFYNLGVVFVAHIFLLLLIPGEDADFGNVGGEEAVENGGGAGDYGGFGFEKGHC